MKKSAVDTNYLQDQTAMLAISPVNKNYQEGMDGETWFLAEGGESSSNILGMSSKERARKAKRKYYRRKRADAGQGIGGFFKNIQKRKSQEASNQAELAKAANKTDPSDAILAASLSSDKGKSGSGKKGMSTGMKIGIGAGVLTLIIIGVVVYNKNKKKK